MTVTQGPALASRLDVIKPSATVAIAQRAAELRSQGIDVLSFSLGEPDFETPEHIRVAARKALDKGSSHYTAARGLPALREAICEDSRKRRGGQTHKADEVVVSVGAKHSLFNLAFALFQEGDEVVIPAPYWVSYPEQVRMVGAEPVFVETTVDAGYKMTAAQLEGALTPRTKALILCSPSNPTGAAYTAAELSLLADVLRKHDCWIIVDEIYAQLVYDGFEQKSILELAPDLRDRIIIVDGCSKTYAMTGWRIGWILSNKRVAAACDTVQGQSTTNPTAIAQHAAIEALRGPQDCVATMRAAFAERRAHIVGGVNSIPGLKCRMPEGAFYAFVDVRGLYARKIGDVSLATDTQVAQFFLDKARVAVVPGEPFGASGYVRFSYATSIQMIDEGLRRIRVAIGV